MENLAFVDIPDNFFNIGHVIPFSRQQLVDIDVIPVALEESGNKPFVPRVRAPDKFQTRTFGNMTGGHPDGTILTLSNEIKVNSLSLL